MEDFPRLDPRQIESASRCAIRWLVRYSGHPSPAPQTITQYVDRLADGYLTCEARLQSKWAQENTLARETWRQELRSLRRNPKRLRHFASEEPLAQILRFGAARADETDDLETLLQQMEEDPGFFEKIISLALEEDKESTKERLLHDPGGRPSHVWCYIPIIHAAGYIFEAIMKRPLGRSTTSTTGSDTHIAGKAIGPGIEFIRQLLAPFKRSFNDEAIAHLIRAAPTSS